MSSDLSEDQAPDPETQTKWQWLANNFWPVARDFFDVMHRGYTDDEEEAERESAREAERNKQEQIEAERAKKVRLEQDRLEALAKQIREDPCMTAIPNGAEAEDLLAAKLEETRNAVLAALKQRDTRAESDIEAAKKLQGAVGEAVKKAEKNAKERKAWKAQHDIATPVYSAAKSKLDPAVATKIDDWWKSVSGTEAAKDYVEALKGVTAMDAVLKQAALTQAPAKRARTQEKVATKSLDSTVAAGLKIKLDAAEDLLTKLTDLSTGSTDLKAAQTAFEAVIGQYKTALTTKAKALETADGGHSMDRHGPDVSDDLLKRRVEKGIAADNVLSPTHTSTKFDKVEDWLATRDAAIVKILADNGVTSTSTPASGDSYNGVIEHNRAIDSGFVADKSTAQNVVMKDTTGQPVYETKNGKLRWKRNSSAEPLDEDGNVVEWASGSSGSKEPKDKDGNPIVADDHATATWPVGKKPPILKTKTFKAYTGHVKVSGLTRTLTTIKFDGTAWKVVQHFPHAEGWNPATGVYDIPI